MAQVIHKQFLNKKSSSTVLTLPARAQILNLGIQDDTPCIWYLFSTNVMETENRQFRVFMTGQKEVKGTYIGTFSIPDGVGEGMPFVGHVFETTESLREAAHSLSKML